MQRKNLDKGNALRSIILSFCLLCSLGATANSADKPKTIVLASDLWCPFFCGPDEKLGPGILTEVINEALAKSSYRLETKEINWARALELAKKGETSGVIGAYKEDAPNFLFTEKAIVDSQDCYYSQKETTFRVTDLSSLNGKRVGIVNSYSYGEKLDAFKVTEEGKKVFMEVSGNAPFEQNLKKLEAGRLDFVLENRAVVSYRSKKNPTAKKLFSNGCNEINGVYAGFSPYRAENPEVIKLIERYMASKIGSQKTEQIIQKYTQ